MVATQWIALKWVRSYLEYGRGNAAFLPSPSSAVGFLRDLSLQLSCSPHTCSHMALSLEDTASPSTTLWTPRFTAKKQKPSVPETTIWLYSGYWSLDVPSFPDAKWTEIWGGSLWSSWIYQLAYFGSMDCFCIFVKTCEFFVFWLKFGTD